MIYADAALFRPRRLASFIRTIRLYIFATPPFVTRVMFSPLMTPLLRDYAAAPCCCHAVFAADLPLDAAMPRYFRCHAADYFFRRRSLIVTLC